MTCLAPWRGIIHDAAVSGHVEQSKARQPHQYHLLDGGREGGYQGAEDWLLTGSIDRTVKMWNLSDGSLMRSWNTQGGAIKAMVVLHTGGGLCVAGGKDICVWRIRDSTLLCRHIRDEDAMDVNLMLALPDHRIVTAAENNLLTVYEILIERVGGSNGVVCPGETTERDTLSPTDHLNSAATVTVVRLLHGHTERIECLSEVFAHGTRFASGSLDGTVRVWSTQGAYDALHVCNPHDVYKNVSKESMIEAYLYRVHDIAVVDHLLVAAIDRGFAVFDVVSGKQVDAVPCAHHAHVTTLAVLGRSGVLITGSADSSIRIW